MLVKACSGAGFLRDKFFEKNWVSRNGFHRFPPSNYFAVGSSLDHECLSTCNVIDEVPCKTSTTNHTDQCFHTNVASRHASHAETCHACMIQTMKAPSILMHARWMPLHVMHATSMPFLQQQSCHVCSNHDMHAAFMSGMP